MNRLTRLQGRENDIVDSAVTRSELHMYTHGVFRAQHQHVVHNIGMIERRLHV